MTILDTFYLLFKTDIPSGVEGDIKRLDKQISDLAAKGKKRSAEEQTELKQLRKQRLEATQDIKDQTRETDKLSDSFQGLITNAVGALTAYASFSFLKNSLVDANNLNASLRLLEQTYKGISGSEVEQYAKTFELFGIKKESFYAAVEAQAQAAREERRPFSVSGFVNNLRRQAGTPQFEAGIGRVAGANALIPGLRASDEDFQRNFALAGKNIPTESDLKSAIENRKAFTETSQSLNKVATEIDTRFTSAVQLFNEAVQNFIGIFKGSPALGITEGGLLGFGATLLSGKIIKGGFNFVKSFFPVAGESASGAGGTAAATIGGAEALGVAIAAGIGVALTWGSGAVGEWIGSKFKGTKSAQQPSTSDSPGSAPLGIRNNNPGNLQPGGHEAIFSSPQAGISALARQLSRYGKRGFNTPEMILRHYAPPSTNNTEAYINDIIKQTGFSRDQRLNLDDPLVLQKLIPAIIKHENGKNPYSAAFIQQSIGGYQIGQAPSIVGLSSGEGAGKTINIKIDDIKIETQATDSAGIAAGVVGELKNQIRMAIANIDDGISA